MRPVSSAALHAARFLVLPAHRRRARSSAGCPAPPFRRVPGLPWRLLQGLLPEHHPAPCPRPLRLRALPVVAHHRRERHHFVCHGTCFQVLHDVLNHYTASNNPTHFIFGTLQAGRNCPSSTNSVKSLAGSTKYGTARLGGSSHKWRVVPVGQDCSLVNIIYYVSRAACAAALAESTALAADSPWPRLPAVDLQRPQVPVFFGGLLHVRALPGRLRRRQRAPALEARPRGVKAPSFRPLGPTTSSAAPSRKAPTPSQERI